MRRHTVIKTHAHQRNTRILVIFRFKKSVGRQIIELKMFVLKGNFLTKVSLSLDVHVHVHVQVQMSVYIMCVCVRVFLRACSVPEGLSG